jgi:hypothetical protein
MKTDVERRLMLRTALEVADFAYQRGIGDALAVDDLVGEYREALWRLGEAEKVLRYIAGEDMAGRQAHLDPELLARETVARLCADGVYSP